MPCLVFSLDACSLANRHRFDSPRNLPCNHVFEYKIPRYSIKILKKQVVSVKTGVLGNKGCKRPARPLLGLAGLSHYTDQERFGHNLL